MAGLGGRGPPVTVRLEVIGDYSREELEAMEAVSQLSSEPCQHRHCPGEGSSLPTRGYQGNPTRRATPPMTCCGPVHVKQNMWALTAMSCTASSRHL